jgi:hypothetical protein
MSIKGIYIDDSGNPGASAPSPFLTSSRKSWAAVIIPESISSDIEHVMSVFLDGIKQDFGAQELHFTEIYSGKGVWKGVSVKKRIEIFDLMVSVVSGFHIPILYQTFSDEFRKDHKELWDKVASLDTGFWNFSRVDHISYFMLLLQIKDAIRSLRKNSADFKQKFRIFTDEGLAKDGSAQSVPCQREDIFEGDISFLNSQRSVGLQIVDFAAFVISKSQRIMMEKSAGVRFSDAERHILNIVPYLNHWSLDLIKVDEESFSREGYEFILKGDRKKKGLALKPKK